MPEQIGPQGTTNWEYISIENIIVSILFLSSEQQVGQRSGKSNFHFSLGEEVVNASILMSESPGESTRCASIKAGQQGYD